MNKCPICGNSCIEEYCWKHKRQKKLKYSKLKKKPKEIDIKAIDKMNSFFLSIWNNSPHICIVTGDKIFGECKSIYMHHILPKKKYPEMQFDPENIAILLPHIHGNVENDMYRYEIINERREYLKTKYNIYE